MPTLNTNLNTNLWRRPRRLHSRDWHCIAAGMQRVLDAGGALRTGGRVRRLCISESEPQTHRAGRWHRSRAHFHLRLPSGAQALHVLLGEEHLDESPTTYMVYETRVPYEDDGLLGTCSSVLLCFLGLQAGKMLMFSRSDRERILCWIGWTAFYWLLILPLVQLPSPYQFNESLLPINFSLW